MIDEVIFFIFEYLSLTSIVIMYVILNITKAHDINIPVTISVHQVFSQSFFEIIGIFFSLSH